MTQKVSDIESNNAGEKKPTGHNKERKWANPIEFFMTCMGILSFLNSSSAQRFAVGLGNVWRFPYLCFKNGGSAFVIAFVIILLLVGLPLFFIDVTLSQFSKFGPLDVWKVVPPLRGIGACSLLVAGFISLYYNVLICYSLIYLISSFIPKLPWTRCDFFWNDEKCCLTKPGNANISFICPVETESPAKQYFEKYVLEMSNGINNPDGINWKLALSLLICWLLVFLSLSKGVKTLGKVSYVTAIFPYIMIFALIIRGATLEGAYKGIEFYILNINTQKLLTLQTWVDATTQVYFCLSIVQGGLYTLGRHNEFNYNHHRVSVIVALMDGFTGILAGFAIFSVLGYMSHITGVEVSKLAVGGPGLSFIVYPEALSLMPFPWIWCIFFFLMMITIGFGSILSLMECVLDSVYEKFQGYLNTKKRETLFRFGACVLFYLIGLTMTTRASLYIENLLNDYVGNYPVIICTVLEAVGIGWIYGVKRFRSDVKLMLGFDLNYYWVVCLSFFTPVLTIVTLILSFISNSEVTLNDYKYPTWAHVIGYLIVVLILSPLPIYFFHSVYTNFKDSKINLENIKKFLAPASDWKPAFDEEKSDENKENTPVESIKMEPYENQAYTADF